MLDTCIHVRVSPQRSQSVTVVIVPKKSLGSDFHRSTCTLLASLAEKCVICVGIAGAETSLTYKDYLQLSPGHETRQERCKFLGSVFGEKGPTGQTVIVFENEETPVPHDYRDFEEALAARGVTWGTVDDLLRTHSASENVGRRIERLVAESNGCIPLIWADEKLNVAESTFDLVRTGDDQPELELIFVPVPQRSPRFFIEWVAGGREEVSVEQATTQSVGEWKKVGDHDSVILEEWVQDRPYRCHRCDAIHKPGEATCNTGQTLLGELLFSSMAYSPGIGAVLIQRNGERDFAWMYLKRGVVPVNDKEIIYRRSGTLNVYTRTSIDSCWTKSKHVSGQFTKIGQEIYGLFA